MQHIIIGGPFSRQIWHDVLAWVRAPGPPPSGPEEFLPWCSSMIMSSPTGHRKGLATLATLTARSIWKQRNHCVFDGKSPSTSRLLELIQSDARS